MGLKKNILTLLQYVKNVKKCRLFYGIYLFSDVKYSTIKMELTYQWLLHICLLSLMYECIVVGKYIYNEENFDVQSLYIENESEFCKSTSNSTHTLLTMFTTMKMKATKHDIFYNTLTIWAQLGPLVRVVVYVDEVDCTEWMLMFIRHLGWEIRVVPKVHPIIPIPIVRYMFVDAIVNYNSTFYMYANGDMLFDHSLIDTLSAVKKYMNADEKVFVVGRRSNYDVASGQRFHALSEVTAASADSVLDHYSAIDYFITSASGYPWKETPDFVVGRVRFDSWLMAHAIASKLITIDATNTLLALHQSGVEGKRESGKMPYRDLNIDMIEGGIAFSSTKCTPYETMWMGNGQAQIHLKESTDCDGMYNRKGFRPAVFSVDEW